MKVGTLCSLHSRLVLVVGHMRRISGGYVVEVEWLEDDTSTKMRLRDGTVHPAGRAGFRWTEPVLNLTECSVVPLTNGIVNRLVAVGKIDRDTAWNAIYNSHMILGWRASAKVQKILSGCSSCCGTFVAPAGHCSTCGTPVRGHTVLGGSK